MEDLTESETVENDCMSCARATGDRRKGLRKAATVEQRASIAMTTTERMNGI